MSIATHYETEAALKGLKSTKNKKLQDAYQAIIYCCQEIDLLRDKLDRYREN